MSLGSSRELLDADHTADKLPKGYHSVKGLGKIAPDPAENLTWLANDSAVSIILLDILLLFGQKVIFYHKIVRCQERILKHWQEFSNKLSLINHTRPFSYWTTKKLIVQHKCSYIYRNKTALLFGIFTKMLNKTF